MNRLFKLILDKHHISLVYASSFMQSYEIFNDNIVLENYISYYMMICVRISVLILIYLRPECIKN